MTTVYSFGEWMKRRRRAMGFTQRELAELSHCSPITIKKIEADQRRPSTELARLLATSLALPHDQVRLFIECARGRRPVDHLELGRIASIPDDISSHAPAAISSAMPVVAGPLIGREVEMETLHRLLADNWLVTIVGVGGIGKTRLALEIVNERQSSGRIAAFVSLVSLRPDDNLAAAIADALGIQMTAGANPTSQLLAYLARKSLLLVLDNFEHLSGSADLLLHIHQAAPELIVLVTSRERLRLPGEQLLPLKGLDYAGDRQKSSRTTASTELTGYPAVRLFLNNARRMLPGFQLNDDDALLELCRITDGLPLALELAAAWVETLTLRDLVKRIADNLDLLSKAEPHRPARHHSIRAVFDTTWQFLGDAEQKAFARLSVFNGGFTLQAAETVAELPLPTLSYLVERYLAQLDHVGGRYSLHELLRQYAAEKLATEPETEYGVKLRHAAFFKEFLADRETDLKGSEQVRALSELRAEKANIWAAWRWAVLHSEEVSLNRAISALGFACWLNNWVEEGYNLFTESTRILSSDQDRLDDLVSLVHLQVWRSRYATWLGKPSAEPFADVRRLLKEIDLSPELRQVLALYHLASEEALRDAGDREAARSHAEQALGLYEGLDDEWGQANALAQLGTVHWNVGAYDKAHAYFEESLAIRRQLGDQRGIAYSLDRLGLLLQNRGEMELSCRYLGQAIELFHELGDRSGMADAMENLASSWLEMGRFENAHRQYSAAAALFEELGLRHTGYSVLKALTAVASAHMGNYLLAAGEASESVVLSRKLAHKRSEGLALVAQGMVFIALGDDSAALAALVIGTEYLRQINQPDELAQGIGLQALAAYRQGDMDLAKRHLLSALAIVSEIRGLLSTPDYPLAVWALMLADQGQNEQATGVYQLVLAEPFGAASRWFADVFGRFIPHAPPSALMPIEERWTRITQLYQSLK